MGAKRHLSEEGSILIQVAVASMVLLGVLLTGFNTVRTTIQSANTTATAATFQDFALAAEQALAMTKDCGLRLGIPSGGTPLATFSAGGELSIPDASGNPMIVAEPQNPPVNPYQSPDYRITSVTITNVARQGWASGALPGLSGPGGTLETERYVGTLTIAAERRREFYGSQPMYASIPLLLNVLPGNPPRVMNCSARPIFSTLLGPPTLSAGITRKTGIECIDRGGTPMIAPGQTWYACHFPVASHQTCDATKTNLPGWFCMIPGTYRTAAYAY